MTYTQHRDTQDTLAVIESLDLDGDPPTQEEVRVFGKIVGQVPKNGVLYYF